MRLNDLSRFSSRSPVLVQLTDTHLFAQAQGEMLGCDTGASFAQVMARVGQVPQLDALLLTGDLSQDDSRESYQHLGSMISPLEVPAYWLPGNHDQNTDATAVLLSQAPFCDDKSFPLGEWQVLLLSTLLPGQVQGRLSSASLAWLDRELSQHPQRPTLVALHHHPLPIGSAWMDAIALENPDDFLQVLDRHSQVKLVLNGHIHQAFAAQRNGADYFGTPSTCVQFKPQTPKLVIDDVGPGFRAIKLHPDGTYETQVIRIPPC